MEGDLRGGGTVAIDYEPARIHRLLDCRIAAYGANLVNLTAHYRFDGWSGFASEALLRGGSPGTAGLPALTPVVNVPAGARELELYFHATAAGCEAYDSNYARNFRFPVR